MPTLSALDALLAAAQRDHIPSLRAHRELLPAADRAMRYLVTAPKGRPPDTVATELIVPALLESLHQRLRDLPGGVLPHWRDTLITPPQGIDPAGNRRVAARLRSDTAPPKKLLHSLEAILPHHQPTRLPHTLTDSETRTDATTLLGASPAASTAWIAAAGGPSHHPGLTRCLEQAVAEHTGPVSCPTPITGFERLWILYAHDVAGLNRDQAETAAREVPALLGRDGACGAPGLPRTPTTRPPPSTCWPASACPLTPQC
ncbi:hypothetical protein ACIBEA_44355 [Streptomyces sp. NPDC051555]|uniref:hypothetical protein n=1 Tax=Streptomyces sp. NPDC051555 TaxID=3365657 RepID=UPI003788B2DD